MMAESMTTRASAATTGVGAAPAGRPAKNSRARGGTVRHTTAAIEHSMVTVADAVVEAVAHEQSEGEAAGDHHRDHPGHRVALAQLPGEEEAGDGEEPQLGQQDQHQQAEGVPQAAVGEQLEGVGQALEDGDAGEQAGHAQQPDDAPQLRRQVGRQRAPGPVQLHGLGGEAPPGPLAERRRRRRIDDG